MEITVPGLEQALAADPSIVRVDVDLDRATLTLTGIALARQSVVYAWTSSGLTVFIAKVVAAPVTPAVVRPSALASDGRGSLYRINVGSGFRKTGDGTQRLPFTLGGNAMKPLGKDRVTFRGDSRPLAEDNGQEASGSAVVQWKGERYRLAAGDQPIELGPQLVTTFPLRGVAAETRVGSATFTAFGGTRTTSSLRLLPDDHDTDPLPALLGGVRAAWNATKELQLTGGFAMAGATPVGNLTAEWRHGIWTACLETAGTVDRLAAGIRLRRQTDDVTVEQRLVHRTGEPSAIIAGVEGLTSETATTYRVLRTLSVTGRVSMLTPLSGEWTGGWYAGADWTPADGVKLALGVDRAFDGSVTAVAASADAQSARFGTAGVVLTRTIQETPAGPTEFWHQSARVERSLGTKPAVKLFAEETLAHAAVQGTLAVSAGAEVEAGWLRASLAPGVIVPTLTDPNGMAQTLRLRLTATPSAALSLHAEARQTFGAKPDTIVQLGIGIGFGSATPWGSFLSSFTTSTVEGVVFVDQNGNGRPDPGEPGLPGVRITIADGQSVVTDGNGKYRLSGLKQGAHSIAIDRSQLPANLRLASASPVAVRLPDGPRTVSFAFVGSGAIHGVVFNDLALSGRFSGAEPGVAAQLVLEGPGTRRTMSVAGAFTLGGLAPGRYRLALDALTLPPAFVTPAPEIEVDIRPGDVVTAQFPVIALRAVEVTVCLGKRPDSQCGDADAPAPKVKVSAGRSGGETDEQGRLLLRELPAGRVIFSIDPSTIPAGWAQPGPVTAELPESPTTVRVSIRLKPAR